MAAYCDNKSMLWDTIVQGIPVLPLQKTKEVYPEAVYIIASPKYAKEIENQLCQEGIRKDHICFYTAGIDMLLFQQINQRSEVTE